MVERAKKLHDLETAKELEIFDHGSEFNHRDNPKQSTPRARSDLPKE